MKIAVNTRLLISGKLDGIGWFTYHTLKNIVKNNPEHTFYFLFDRKYDKNFIFSDNVKPIIIWPPTRHPVLWFIWLNITVPKVLRKIKPDIFLSTDGFLPNTKIPSITVIHDINFVHYPKDLPFFTRLFYNNYMPKFAKKAKKIGTVSNYSRNDIVKNYKIKDDKIKVLYNGASDIYKPVNSNVKEKIKEKYTGNKDFFIFIGSIHPRKNIKRLIKAFDIYKKETNSDNKLVIVGAKFFKNSELFNILNNLKFKDDIIFMGRLNIGELHKILASALSMVFVPYFEGFGIPLLEAMYCDVPVISANVTSMPEVAGDAAIYVNPFDIDEIAKAMKTISTNKKLRKELIKKAQRQRLKFSWEKTSKKLWKIIIS